MTFTTLMSASALALGAAFLVFPSHGFAANTNAAKAVTKACSTKYEAAKKANSLYGKTWQQYLHDCSASMKRGGAAAPSKTPPPAGKSPISAPVPAVPQPAQAQAMTTEAHFQLAAETTTTGPKQPMPRKMGFRQRVHECKAEWKADRASGKVSGRESWKDYWKDCNIRLNTQQ